MRPHVSIALDSTDRTVADPSREPRTGLKLELNGSTVARSSVDDSIHTIGWQQSIFRSKGLSSWGAMVVRTRGSWSINMPKLPKVVSPQSRQSRQRSTHGMLARFHLVTSQLPVFNLLLDRVEPG